jgi:TPR repeat protein
MVGLSKSKAPGEAPQPWVERLFRAPPTQGSEVLRQTLAAAQSGNIEAQVALGRGYLLGLPAMKRDVEEARFWFTRASNAGQREADSTLQAQAARRFAFEAEHANQPLGLP